MTEVGLRVFTMDQALAAIGLLQRLLDERYRLVTYAGFPVRLVISTAIDLTAAEHQLVGVLMAPAQIIDADVVDGAG